MISGQKLRANRANARASTGPKTAGGKRRTARNSRKHGLSLPVVSDPTLARDVDDLAQKIAGKNASQQLRECARHVAAAQLDIIRVRRARTDAPNRAWRRFDDPSHKKLIMPRSWAADLAQRVGSDRPILRSLRPVFLKAMEEDKFGPSLADCLKQITALDRYERRSLSRRKFAIRKFDAMSGSEKCWNLHAG